MWVVVRPSASISFVAARLVPKDREARSQSMQGLWSETPWLHSVALVLVGPCMLIFRFPSVGDRTAVNAVTGHEDGASCVAAADLVGDGQRLGVVLGAKADGGVGHVVL